MPTAGLHQALLILIYIGIAVGFIGQAIPFFPSLQVIWLAVLGYGLLTGFARPGAVIFAAITLLMIVDFLLDNVLMSAGARAQGTSWLALGAGLAALLIGSLLWTPLGGLAAAFGAVFLVELVRLKDSRQALASMKGMAIGCGWSALARLATSLIMIGLWLVWYFWLSFPHF